jgi:hypothetical protein
MTKTETVTVVVYPSGADADTLTVADAMQQVLDTFALLGKVEAQRIGSKQIVWRLERASTNSPFTVLATAVSVDPSGSIEKEACLVKAALGEGLFDIVYGRDKASWIDQDAETIIRRILKRNLNGIGRTDVRFDDDMPAVVIDHRAASKGVSFLEAKAAEAAAVDDLTRTEYGSVEGNVIGVVTYYNKPAFSLRTRLSGREVKCVLRPEIAERIGGGHAWKEAWGGQRVLVKGCLHYGSGGDLLKVDVEDIAEIKSQRLNVADIRENQYVTGFSPADYLDEAWGDSNA